MPNVAIYGGAFNPPHLAHLFTVTYLLTRDDVDEVWLLPAADHVFGKAMAPFDARQEMLSALVEGAGWPRVKISTAEVDRGGVSRTFDTLSWLSAKHPGHRFILVIGADNLTASDRWYRFDDLVARWPVIGLGRPGHEAALEAACAAGWCRRGPTLPAISSTAVRAALGCGGGAALAWLPDACRARAETLYGGAPRVASVGPVWIFGAGRVGRALAKALAEAGVEVAGIWNRSERGGATAVGALPDEAAGAPVWLLCVSDPALPEVASRLAKRYGVDAADKTALHCAGRFGAEVLRSLHAVGARTGSMHPLQAVRDDGGAFVGVHFAVEGAEAKDTARALVTALGGHPVEVPLGGKGTYHAAAVLAANFVVTLGAGGVALLGALGVEAATARAMLGPLLRGTLDGFERQPAVEALTGPMARGDLEAIATHRVAIARHAPAWSDAYAALCRSTAQMMDWDDEARAALEVALRPAA